MSEILEYCFVISLCITAVHVSMWQGMILGGFRVEVLDKHLPELIKKPLYECLPCMASLWTLLLYPLIDSVRTPIDLLSFFIVCGINTLIDSFINYCSHNPLNR